MQFLRHTICSTCLAGAIVLFAMGNGFAAEKITATVLVKDSLAALNQQATVEAKVFTKGLLQNSPLGGEPVELVIDHTVVASAMTGGDGRAFLTYVPRARKVTPVQVRVGNSPRVSERYLSRRQGSTNSGTWKSRWWGITTPTANRQMRPEGWFQ